MYQIDVNELINHKGEGWIVDIAIYSEFCKGHIPGSINMPMGRLLENPELYLDKGKKYFVVCKSGMKSKYVVRKLLEKGYNVINVVGGISRYKGALATCK